MSSAFVTRPAPEFTATTVFPGGEFKDISLSEYRGQWYVPDVLISTRFHLGLPPAVFRSDGEVNRGHEC